MSLFPKEPQKIRARIRRYERLLRKEQQETGFMGDGYGKRYLLGPLYMLLGDVEGALESYAWFDVTCQGDRGHPMQLLCWALAHYRAGNLAAARRKLLETIASNRYVIPCLLGGARPEPHLETGEHIGAYFDFEDMPPEILALWDEAALQWVREIYDSPETRQLVK